MKIFYMAFCCYWNHSRQNCCHQMCPVVSFLYIFQIYRQPKRIRKHRNHKKNFVHAGISF